MKMGSWSSSLSGITLGLLQRIGFSDAVVTIQKRIASLRRRPAESGAAAGLPSWHLWMVLAQVFCGFLGVDFFGRASAAFLWSHIGVGIAGLPATLEFHFWLRRPGRALLAAKLLAQAAGVSFARAEKLLANLESGLEPDEARPDQ